MGVIVQLATFAMFFKTVVCCTVLMQINNPDKRCVILKSFAKEHFPSTPLIDYATEVEKITTSKVSVSRSC